MNSCDTRFRKTPETKRRQRPCSKDISGTTRGLPLLGKGEVFRFLIDLIDVGSGFADLEGQGEACGDLEECRVASDPSQDRVDRLGE
jgi:hypothetical protein